MTNRNAQNHYNSSRTGRSSIPNARDELDRERQLYSAHDPRQSSASPAQQAAEAQQERSFQPIPNEPWQQSANQYSTGSWSSQRQPETSGRKPSADYRSGAIPATKGQPDASAYSRSNTAYTTRNAQGARQANRPSRRSTSSYDAGNYTGNNRKRSSVGPKALIAVVAIIALVAVGVFAFNSYQTSKPVDVTINGSSYTIEGDQRSISGLLDNGIVSAKAGNYVAVDGSTMREGEGTRCTATLNGSDTTDFNALLNDGDDITIADGTDIMESYTDSDVQVLEHGAEITGRGAVHLYMGDGQDGEKVVRTGNESGISTDIVVKEAVNETVQYYNVDTGGDKVIALTFDDGPWDSWTQEILDILKENNAKATFFTVGQRISGHEDLVKRAVSEGHEVGTHTYDHAAGSGGGVSLIKMSTDERKQEVEQGLSAISSATGSEASTVFRAPGGNFDSAVATDLEGLVTAEIGWNIDTNDWQRPGADVIAQRILQATGGDIILMHDGGGDRSQTVEALRTALPQLAAQGYTFVTVQELIEKYPYQGN